MSESRMSHQECWELLPWLANGSLDAGEARRVAEHLEVCAICRQEELACRELSELLATGARGAELPPGEQPPDELDGGEAAAERLSPEHGFARLSQRIDAERAAAPEPAARGGSRLARWVRDTPPAVRAVVAAQLAALLILAVFTGWSTGRDRGASGSGSPDTGSATFRTLSDAPPQAPATAVRLRLVFAEDATLAAVRELLVSSEARLVDGPSPFGVYTVELPETTQHRQQLDTALTRLRQHPAVVFAEPATAQAVEPAE